MNRRSVFSFSAMTVLGLALLPSGAIAQQKSLKEQVVGTWTLVSLADVQKDGSRVERFGRNPKGMLVFDGNGHYSLIIVRPDLPKFASNKADQGTADENKAVMHGLVAHFGTYSVNEADKTITTRVEGSWFPNLSGGGQKRVITSLTADELKYTNPTPAVGTNAEVVWKRAK
jgi:Lipocalin-like domain